jgi:hypothetical protein
MNHIKETAKKVMSTAVATRHEDFIAALDGCYKLGVNPLPKLREQGIPCSFKKGDGFQAVASEFSGVDYSCICKVQEFFSVCVSGGWVIFGNISEIKTRLERAQAAMFAARELWHALIEEKRYCEYRLHEMETAAVMAAWQE